MNKLLAFLFILSQIGCSAVTYPRHSKGVIIPYKNGVYIAISKLALNEVNAYKYALSEAKYQCEEQNKRSVVLNRKNTYEGLTPKKAAEKHNKIARLVPVMEKVAGYKCTLTFVCE